LILIGMFDSPFVRRVAVSMNLLGMAFEHRNWSVGKDFDLIRQFNPLGRVPTLVQPDGEALIESTAILDLLDEHAGPDRALLPRSWLTRSPSIAPRSPILRSRRLPSAAKRCRNFARSRPNGFRPVRTADQRQSTGVSIPS
jgi:hypothetical protein